MEPRDVEDIGEEDDGKFLGKTKCGPEQID